MRDTATPAAAAAAAAATGAVVLGSAAASPAQRAAPAAKPASRMPAAVADLAKALARWGERLPWSVVVLRAASSANLIVRGTASSPVAPGHVWNSGNARRAQRA